MSADFFVDMSVNFLQDMGRELSDPWKIFGVGAQAMFMMRFMIQWITSERLGKSVIPPAFWYFSILGACALLIYGIREREPVIIFGQSLPMVIYVRNLLLLKRQIKQDASRRVTERCG